MQVGGQLVDLFKQSGFGHEQIVTAREAFGEDLYLLLI